MTSRAEDVDSSGILKQLAHAITKIANEISASGKFGPEEAVYYRRKIKDFEYTDAGVKSSGEGGEYITKESWFSAITKIEEEIGKTDEFSQALANLKATFGEAMRPEYLQRFSQKLLRKYLSIRTLGDPAIDSYVAFFLKELHGEPVLSSVQVEIQGITLRPDVIKLASGVTLRKPRREDLEKETWVPWCPG